LKKKLLRDGRSCAHGESLATHGGLEGLRDEGLLDSARGRPVNLLAYADPATPPDFAALAASYAVELAKNHAFVDGNKRVAFLATGLFLYLNGYRLNASQADTTITVLGLAAGDITENEFADWLRAHASAR
jgi:death-on-curing protein